ncbi:MAG: transglycosylase SLT domain-containing protein [Cognaticolwellia aestuarii]
MTKVIAFIVIVYSSFFVSSASGQTLNSQRQTFLKAEKQVWQANSPTYIGLYNQLHYYPLQPYLDLKRLSHRIRLNKADEIGAFLEKYKDSPLDWPLRSKWLNYLAKKKRKALFLKYYKANSNAKLNCLKLSYQLDAGTPESVILPAVTKLWLVGKSQDKVCDPLFTKWQKAGYRTEDIVWQRIALAADGGKHTLIPYLTKLLPEKQKPFASLWHKVRRDPAYVTRLTKFDSSNEKSAQILSYGFKRFIWRDPNRALNAFAKAKQQFNFTEQQLKTITAKFAVALATKNHPKAEQWLVKVDESLLSKSLVQWKLADVLQQQDWHKVNSTLKALPQSKQQDIQWRYWFARSLIETEQLAQGQKLMTELAKERHYYGFLAASRIKQPINLQHKPLVYTEQQQAQIIEHPAAKRAFELFHLARYNEARKEWNYWLSQLSSEQKLIAATIAYQQGWFDRPIFTLAYEGYLDDVEMRFPFAYRDIITQYAQKNSIDPSWAFAIARRESSFMADAYSSVGARGLMQIMPATAKQLERKTVSSRYLLKAENNIKLGTKYLKQLLSRHSGNLVLATAAYNAGPYRVKQWLNDNKSLPADVWIETIPFKETRDYVKSVLAYKQIYLTKLQSKAASPFSELLEMQIQ